MQVIKHAYYHSKKFSVVMMNYPTYKKELFSLVQAINKWKYYLMGKETIFHTDR